MSVARPGTPDRMLAPSCRRYLVRIVPAGLVLARLRTYEPIDCDREDLRRDDLERMQRYQ